MHVMPRRSNQSLCEFLNRHLLSLKIVLDISKNLAKAGPHFGIILPKFASREECPLVAKNLRVHKLTIELFQLILEVLLFLEVQKYS